MFLPRVNRSPFPANSSFNAATNFSLILSLCGDSGSLVRCQMLQHMNVCLLTHTPPPPPPPSSWDNRAMILIGILTGRSKWKDSLESNSSNRLDWSGRRRRGLKVVETNRSVRDRVSWKQSPRDVPDVWRCNRYGFIWIWRGYCYLPPASSASLGSASHQWAAC